MPTQEERLSALEQTVPSLRKSIQDMHYNATILLGVTSEQGKDIREMKVSLAVLNERLGAFEQMVTNRFETLENRFGTLEHSVGTLEHSVGTLEHSVSSRFDAQDKKFEAQDKKFDQIVLLLNTLVSKLGQET